MSRSLEAGVITALGEPTISYFHLVTFYFSGEIRLTDHAHDLSYDFGSGLETFLSTARLESTGGVEETISISNPSINLTLSGANQADIALALTENFNNKRVLIRRGFFDTSGETMNSNIIVKPFIVFDGRVDSFDIVDDPVNGDSSVTWKLSSHMADWERIAGRKCNNQNAQVFFPNEQGFSYVYDQIGERTWGRIRS